MKINKVIGKNFKSKSIIEVSFPDGITHLIGLNRNGKSTLRDIINIVFAGNDSKNRKYMNLNPLHRLLLRNDLNKKAEGVVVCQTPDGSLIEFKRSITNEGIQKLRIKTLSGKISIKNSDIIFNSLFLYPSKFAELPATEQAKMIVPDLDLSLFQEKEKSLKAEYTQINSNLTATKNYIDSHYSEYVKIFKENDYNKEEHLEAIKNRDEYLKHKEDLEKWEKRLSRESIMEIVNNPDYSNKSDSEKIDIFVSLYNIPTPVFDKKVFEHLEEIVTAYDILKKLSEDNKSYQNDLEILDTYTLALASNKRAQEENSKAAKKILSKIKLPLDNFQINLDGELIFIDESGKEKYFNNNFFSQSEIIIHTVRLLKQSNNTLKMIFIDNASLLDDQAVEEINSIAGEDIQIIYEEVLKSKPTGDNVIDMREISDEPIKSKTIKSKTTSRKKKEVNPPTNTSREKTVVKNDISSSEINETTEKKQKAEDFSWMKVE